LELITRLHPDIALLDITMPGLNGLEVAARVRESSPRTRVIVLSMHAGETYVAQALRAGVAGYLLKDSAASDLQAALEAVGRGGTFLSPAISQQVVASYLRGQLPSADPLEGLSPRQREVLQLIAEGRSTKEIAADLELSNKTVERVPPQGIPDGCGPPLRGPFLLESFPGTTGMGRRPRLTRRSRQRRIRGAGVDEQGGE
ncbi:MAG: response regulator transcription factor, partial [Acidobacteria bacterium]|nr:response regulator transcription factor [Acidobacteriota bacterium]